MKLKSNGSAPLTSGDGSGPGKNFCMAAKDGFETVWSNGMRYLIVAGVGDMMMFIGKLMIAAGATALFYCLITFVTSIKENIIEPIYLLVVTM